MKIATKKRATPPAIQNHLSDLEEKAAQMGIHVHYDVLEAAGLRLKGGICKIKEEYHIFIDKRKSTAEKIDILQDSINNPLPEDVLEAKDHP